MLVAILFLALTLGVFVVISVDVARTPTEAPAGHVEHHPYDPGRTIAGAHIGARAHAFPREPVVREKAVLPTAAPAGFGAAPADVDSFARTEQTTRAFDQMRREMSQSAADEAALRSKFNNMYLNLSRRSQALVERQLRLIESLEHGERDQQRLASLSKLNRIAMRMHRNSQNLLVLAGQEPSTSWNQPVTLAHLVEAALSEIEAYERVSFQIQPDIAIRGSAVHDAVHLLVELIDNATSFSAADMPVHITGRILSSGGALIDITDRGIGMAAKEMTYANQQLDNPPAPDIDVPKWMGLLVVARLAVRHGMRVRLNQAELGGLTALVWFPDAAAAQRAAAVGSPALAAARMTAQDTAATRAEPLAARLSGSGRLDAPVRDIGVVVPRAESQPTARRLPIFDEVESRWSRGGHEAPNPSGLAASGPAPSGLPKRPPPAPSGPRPGMPTGGPNRPGVTGRDQHGASQGWAVPSDEASPGGPDEP
jgi:hypothetical protein